MLLLLLFCSSRPAILRLVLPYSRYIQYFSMVMSVMACGVSPKPEPMAVKPPTQFAMELEPLVDAYIADAEAASSPVSPEFRQQLVQVIWQEDMGQEGEERVLGRCDRFNENHIDRDQRFRTVHIQKPDAKGYVGTIKLDALTLKTVVYHELGHCLHDFRGHLPKTSPQIMSAELPSDRFQEFPQLLNQHFSLVKKLN